MIPQLRSRRLLVALPIIAALILVGYILSQLVQFAHIFGIFKSHSGVKITQVEIAIAHNQTNPDPRKPVVPKITHQIFHAWKHPGNNTLPDHWERARQTCLKWNPDWDHKLWTTENSRQFLVEHFPWYVPTYDGYKFPIQRVDVLRYFVIRHYGGIYLDLDNGCAADLEPLTYYPAFTTDGGHGALSNNIMGGQPAHPWFMLMTESLIPWNWNWILPYVIISYSSGQWFITAMWEKYHSLLSPDGTISGFQGSGWRPLHHILMDMRPGADPWVFFTQVRGGTWSNWDSGLFPWIGDHIPAIAGGITLFVGLCIWACVWCARRRRKPTKGKGYEPLAAEEHNLQER